MKTRITLIKMFAAAMLAAGLNSAAIAQTCQAAFTYTVGSSGHVDINNTSTGGGSFTQYYWSFGDNSTFQQQYPSSHTYMYNGNYTITLYMTDSLNGGGCSSTYTASVAINNTNTCNLAVSYTYSLGSNGQVNFTNTSTGINAGMIVSWNFGDGNTSNQSSPSNVYTYNGSYGVSLNITDTLGYCVGTQFDTITVVNAQPTPTCNTSFTYTLSANGQVDFTGSESGNLSNPIYYWDFGDGATSYGMNATHAYGFNGTFNVYFHASDSLHGGWGCSSMQQITITNSGGCPDSVYFYVGPDSSQAGSWNVYLYSNHYNSMMNAVWSWGDGTSSSGLFPSHTYASPGMYSICATVFFACGDTVTYCQNDSVYRSSSHQMISVHVINTQSGVQGHVSASSSLNSYPNPFADELTVNLSSYKGQEVSCSLYDVMGNLVMRDNVVISGDSLLKFKTNDLGNGIYFVRVTARDGMSNTLKVVK